MRVLGAREAASLLRPEDSLATAVGPGEPAGLLEALGERDDWKDLKVFASLLTSPYRLFERSGVRLTSGFFGPFERALRDAGHAVSFMAGDLRRMALYLERRPSRVMATAVAPPDSEGWMSLSLHAGATVGEIERCARDPERLLVVEVNPRLPRTLGIPPDHRHAVHVDRVDVLIEHERPPPELPGEEADEVTRAIADFVKGYVHEGDTLQTGIGPIPDTVASLLAEAPGGDYGVHTELFTVGLMRLHEAGKVSNARKGIFEGLSVATFAMGTAELYAWLDGQEAVRFLPVEWINTPSIIARNRNMRSINGALMIDLAGQVVADSIAGRQHSGIGGHEDFTSGASLESDDRSLICLPSSVGVNGRSLSRIVARLPEGSLVTTPRHQLDVVVTEYGAAEVSCSSVRERARALAEIAHPDHRDELRAAAERLD